MSSAFGVGARARLADDELYEYGDDYDDEDYGSDQPKYYPGGEGGLIDGSGTYDDEDISDESNLIRQALIQRQLAAQEAAKKSNTGGFGQMGMAGAKPGFLGGAGGFSAGGAGGIGAKSSGLMAGGLGGASKPSAGGGGFVYGAASGGGASLFGAASAAQGSNTFASGLGGTQFGAPPKSTGGGFAFGQASQFGGASSLFGAGAAGGIGGMGGMGGLGGLGGGAAAADDPYNIDIDLTKIKRTAQPAKTFEEKSSAEKLKTMQEMQKESEATGARSIIKKPGDSKGKKATVSFGQCLVYEYDKESTATAQAKRVDSKDISDMRDEKTKIRDMLQAQENEEIKNAQRLREMMKTQSQEAEEKEKAAPSPNKFKSSASKNDKIDESIQESQSLSQSKERDNKTQSMDTDTYSSVSKSLERSSQKQGGGINYWPGKQAFEKEESISKSQEQPAKTQVHSANAMEEYMKRQQAAKVGTTTTTAAKPATSSLAAAKDVSESSDKYTDEDFESVSKSKGNSSQMDQALQRVIQEKKNPTSFQPKTFQPSSQTQQYNQMPTRIASTYVKKVNVFTQTDSGKYSFMTAEEGIYAGTAEWSLKRNLEDAELLIQEHLNSNAETKDQMIQIAEKMKKVEMEYRDIKRELMGEKETNKRLKEQLEQKAYTINMFQIETESLIKQVDLADSKTRDKDDEIKLLQSEYDKKMQLQIERILLRRNKDQERGLYDLKREHQLEIEKLKNDLLEAKEENDYLTQKVAKLDSENTSLKLGKGDNKRMKELENEVDFLKIQLQEAQKSGGAIQSQAQTSNVAVRSVKKELSQDEQRQLQMEVQQLDQIVKGYQEENIKAIEKHRDLESKLKALSQKHEASQKQVREYQLKQLKQKGGVFIEDDEEVDMQAQNVMGAGQAISQKQLSELQQRLKELQRKADNAQTDLTVQANQFRQQIQKLRDEKHDATKMLTDIEFIVGGKDKEIEVLRDEKTELITSHQEKVKELEDKLNFFRDNQRFLAEDEDQSKGFFKENQDLKQQLVKYKEDKKRLHELEKKCRLLEETINNKNPNSIGMLIQAAKTDAVNDQQSESKKELQQKIDRLIQEKEFDEREFEKKVRTLRQELERVKSMYESKGSRTPEAKQVKQLEEELQKTKDYYNKRIREIEDKYKYGMGKAKAKPPADAPKSNRSASATAAESKDIKQLKIENEVLMKNNRLLAQKVAELEHNRIIQRKASFISGQDSGRSDAGTPVREKDPRSADLNHIFYQGQSSPDQSSIKGSSPPLKKTITEMPPQSTFGHNQLNPFDVPKKQQKSIPQLLQALSQVDFHVNFGGKEQMKLNQMYQVLASELGMDVSVGELKSLNGYLQSKQNADGDAQFLDQDESVIDLKFLHQMVRASRPSGSFITDQSAGQQEVIDQLRAEVKRLKMFSQNDNDYMLTKNQQLQRDLVDGLNKQKDMQNKIVKLEAQKQRIEDVFKSTMKGGTMDLIDQVQMMVRKIEFLEEQSEQRAKATYLQNQEPLIREIEMLKQKLAQEREIREQVIEKKNAEVRSFKSQLDALLSEMQNQFNKKKTQTKVY